MKKTAFYPCLKTALGLMVLLACHTGAAEESAQPFAFALLADPRAGSEGWKNALSELRDGQSNRDPVFRPAELIVVAGDMDPLAARHEDYRNVFTNASTRPVFLPVIGNHEFAQGGEHFRYARDVLVPAIPGAVLRHASSCDYYVDHKNVRIIAVDAYTDLGKNGVVNDKGRRWVEQAIQSAPASIDHIFVSLHEPPFPRLNHVGESFDRDPKQRDAFWRMLLLYRNRVRAVLVGHTHHYYRMRVLDPSGEAANNPKTYPNEEGGIWQIDAGAAGHGDMTTFVQIQINNKDVAFRVLQAKPGASDPFKAIDAWTIPCQP